MSVSLITGHPFRCLLVVLGTMLLWIIVPLTMDLRGFEGRTNSAGDTSQDVLQADSERRASNLTVPTALADSVSSSAGDSSSAQETLADLARVKGNTRLIIYNRVSKCASTTVKEVFSELGGQVGFNVYSSRIYATRRLKDDDQRSLVNEISHMRQPLVYDRHVFFINFTQFGFPQPVYLNVVRDPITRFVSAYYYNLYQCKYFPKKCPWSHWVDFNETVDHCVQHNPSKRCKAPFNTIPYFCGQDDRCVNPGRWSLNKAKDNLVRYYTVVGIAEYLTQFFQVLGKLLPWYFSRATALYKNGGHEMHENTIDITFRVPPSPRTVEILKNKLKYEYEFYEFAKQRFYEQYKYVMRRN